MDRSIISVDAPPDNGVDAPAVFPDSLAGLFGSFAGADLVGQGAAALDVLGRHGSPDEWVHWTGRRKDPTARLGVSAREGVVWRVEVSPGSIAVSRRDHMRHELTAERNTGRVARQVETEWDEDGLYVGPGLPLGPVCAVKSCGHASCGLAWGVALPSRRGRVRSWSAKSRASMVKRLNTLDYGPLVEQGAPAMLTLTYPGDWLPVAPDAATCQKHLRAFQLRYKRKWRAPLMGVWKREFQARGAPHFHVLMVPPAARGGEFEAWVSRTWAGIVDHPDPVQRAAHERAGTNVDRREGSRFTDPRRVGAYFSKHGTYSAKDYQNEAPAAWLADETVGIGRFWGVWGLEPAVAVVEVAPDMADAVRRTARRWQAATVNRRNPRDRVVVEGRVYRAPAAAAAVPRRVWRKRAWETLDVSTGELVTRWKWTRRSTTTRIRPHLRGRAGFMALNDGPGLALALGAYLEQLAAPQPWPRGQRRPLP